MVYKSKAAPPDVTFLCDRIPEVCTNMCWATRCASPRFSLTLTFDNPSEAVKRKRRASAGCGGTNKCNPKGKGVGKRPGNVHTSCDEYPFASTAESKYPNGHQVSRCVPNKQNSSQGGTLAGLVEKLKKKPGNNHRFRIGLGNPGSRGVRYCSNQACKNDGWQVQDKQIKRRDEDPVFKLFKTESGMVLATMEEIEPMSNFTREVDLDGARLAGSFDTWTEEIETNDGGHDSLTFMSDIVIGEMSQGEIAAYLQSQGTLEEEEEEEFPDEEDTGEENEFQN